MQKAQVLESLQGLNQYLKSSGLNGQILYRSENSHLVRCGANQISLNSYEENEKLYITLEKNQRTTQFSLAYPLREVNTIKKHIDQMAKTLEHLPALSYLKPWAPLPKLQESASLNENADPVDTRPMVQLFAETYKQFRSLEVEASGMFSAGQYAYALINTSSDHALYHLGSDYHLEVVLQLLKHQKREIKVSSVGEHMQRFNPESIQQELAQHAELKTSTPNQAITPGSYNLVFGQNALAYMLEYFCYMCFRGELYQENKGMLRREAHKLGDQIFGQNVTLSDDPSDTQRLFRRSFGMNGMTRSPIKLIDKGQLQNLYFSDKLTCDRLATPMFHDFQTASWSLHGGSGPSDLSAMLAQTEVPTVYVNNLHYMNFTNLNRGEFTATARFGAYFIKDGKIQSNPGKLRLNLSLFEMFNKVDWLAKEQVPVNTSSSYDVRLPSSIRVPKFVQFNSCQLRA